MIHKNLLLGAWDFRSDCIVDIAKVVDYGLKSCLVYSNGEIVFLTGSAKSNNIINNYIDFPDDYLPSFLHKDDSGFYYILDGNRIYPYQFDVERMLDDIDTDIFNIDIFLDEDFISKQIITDEESDGLLIVPDKNIDAVKYLIKKYRSITREIAIDHNCDLSKLTGFGNMGKCKVCRSVNKVCELCIHSQINETNNCSCPHHITYNLLEPDNIDLGDIDTFLVRLENRAKYLENMLDEYYSEVGKHVHNPKTSNN